MMKNKAEYFIIYILTVLLLSPAFLYNQTNSTQFADKDKLSVLVPSSTRFVVNLGGTWEKSLDEEEWQPATIPFSEPDDRHIIYRRTIKIERNLISRYNWQLYFLGCDDQVEIYFNEQFLGKYFGGMTPFTVQIPQRMIFREANTIKLIVSAAKDAARKIEEQNLFLKKVYSGIIRDLLLIGTPNIWVSDIKYRTVIKPDLTSANIKAKITLSAASLSNFLTKTPASDSLAALGLSKTTISLDAILKNKMTGQVVAQHQPINVEIEQERTIQTEILLAVNNPLLWSVTNPNLYELTIRINKSNVLIDDLSTSVGFNQLWANHNNGQIYLNGKPVEFKGVDYIEDYWKTGQTLTASRMEQDILMMKTLGANIVRFKYNLPHPYLTYLCDKYGLLALLELPVYDIPTSITNLDEIKVRMRNLADRMFVAFDNNPSIIAWGISEGLIEGTEPVTNFQKDAFQQLKSLSPKLIYKIVNISSKEINPENCDFIGVRENRKYKTTDEIREQLDRVRNLTNNIPLFFAFGMPIQPLNHNGYSDPSSIESQAYYILNLYHLAKDKKFIGSLVWSFNDYLLQNPLLIMNNLDNYTATTGITDKGRQNRLSFSTLQSLFNEEKEPLFNAGSYSEKTPVFFIVLGVILCLIIIFLLNRFKRFKEYLFRSAFRPFNFYADIRDQRIISSIQSLVLGLVLSFTLGIYLASILYYFRSSEVAQVTLSLLIPYRFAQDVIYRIIWQPEFMTLLISLLFYFLIFIIALLLKISSVFVRGRIYYSDVFTITIWSGTPILILLPVSIILIRLLVFSPGLVWLALILFIILMIWIIMRVLKATSVVFDIQSNRVYTVGGIIIALIVVAVLSVYQYQFSVLSFASHLLKNL